jgi:S1-C subfamily serine protease
MHSIFCPHCKRLLTVTTVDIPAGVKAKVTCRHCKQAFQASADQFAKMPPLPFPSGPSPAATTPPKPQPAAPPPMGVSLPPEPTPPAAAGAPLPQPDLAKPAEAVGKRSRVPLFVAAGVIVTLLAAGGGAGAWVMLSKKSDDVAGGTPPSGPAAKPDDKGGSPDDDRVIERQPLPGELVHERVLRGCVYIRTRDGNGRVSGYGSGWLADKEKKVVVTAYHVIDGASGIEVFFPIYDGAGKPIDDVGAYDNAKDAKDAGRKAIKATLMKPAEGRGKDVAVLQLDGDLPDKVRAVPLAAAEAKPGQQVYSIGSSGVGGGALWRNTKGGVKTSAIKKELKAKGAVRAIDAFMLELDSEINPGDSGGPVVNDRAEAVALVSAYSLVERSVAYGIDLQEIRATLEKTFEKNGWKWDDVRAAPAVPVRRMEEWVRQVKDVTSPGVQIEAARKLGAMEFDGQPAVPALLDALLATPDEAAQEAIYAALENIGTPLKLDGRVLVAALKSNNVLAQTYAAGVYARVVAPREAFTVLVEKAKAAGGSAKEAALRERAVLAFKKVGPSCKAEVLEILFDRLDDDDRQVAEAAKSTLSEFIRLSIESNPTGAPFDRADVRKLQVAIRHRNERLRLVAAYAYCNMAESYNAAKEFYHAGLFDDPSYEVRVRTIEGLARWGKEADEHLTRILSLHDHGVPEVRKAVVRAAEKLTWTKDTTLTLVKMVETDADDGPRDAAFAALVKTNLSVNNIDRDEHLRLFVKLLHTNRLARVEQLAMKVQQQKPRLESRWADLNRDKQGGPKQKRSSAKLEETEETLRAETDSHNAECRQVETEEDLDIIDKVQVINQLKKFGPAAGVVTGDLVKLLKHRDPRVRVGVLEALKEIGADAGGEAIEQVVLLLIGTLTTDTPLEDAELDATRLLRNVRDEEVQKKVAKRLVYQMQQEKAAVAALTAFGKPAVRPLAQALEVPKLSADVKKRVCAALCEIGHTAPDDCVPRLFGLAMDDKELRPDVARALAKIGGDGVVDGLLDSSNWSKLAGKRQADAPLRLWAYTTFGDLNLTGLSEAALKKVTGRLEFAATSDPSAECKQKAKLALNKLRADVEKAKQSNTNKLESTDPKRK